MSLTIPQIDLDLDIESLSPRELQAAYEAELDRSDVLIVILEGVEAAAWTGFECGYARARGKFIYGITSKDYVSGARQQRIAAMCDELIYYSPGDDITKSHAEISHALATRVMVQNQ